MEPDSSAVGDQASPSWTGVALGRYRIGERIAVGGMGEVYRGRDEVLGKDVAVKALTAARADDERSRHRFAREARYACRVQHPFVCSVLDVVEHREDIFLVLEYIDGRQFDTVLREDHPSQERILDWAIEITEALSAIHKAGLVHRDLKPGNVMIASDGHVKVTDFGVARATRGLAALDSSSGSEATLTEAGHAVGTIAYMSPEQLRGDRVDARSDLFSLGILLWQAVTGEHPFDRGYPMATASAILSEPPGSGAEPDSLTQSGSLRDVVIGLLHKEPSDRYDSADVVLRDLRAIARGERIRPLLELEAVRARRRRIRWIAAALVGVAAVATAAVVLSRRPWDTGALPPVPPRALIAVLPFELRGVDDADARGDMLADLVAATVSDSGAVRRTPTDRMDELLQGLPPGAPRGKAVARLASMASPRFIVAGTVYKVEGGFESAVDLYGEDGVATGSFRVRAPSYLGLVDATSAQLLAAVGGPSGAGRAKRAEAAGTRSDEAALLLAKAKKAGRELRFGDALQLVEQALAIDPRYLDAAIAHVEYLDRCGYGRRCAEAGEQLARLVDSLALPANSRGRLEAEVALALARNQPSGRYAILKTLATRYPDEPALIGALAISAVEGGHREEALALSDRALALDPKAPSLLIVHARAARMLEKFDVASRDLDAADRLVRECGSEPGAAAVLEARGHLARQAEKAKDAESFYLACADAFDKVGRAGNSARCRANAADFRIAAGDLNGARTEILPAITQARATGALGSVVEYLTTLGAAEYVGGAFGEAESTLREAYSLGRQIESDRTLLFATVNLAGLIGNTDRFGEALGLADESIALARAQGNASVEAAALAIRCDASLAEGRLGQARGCYSDLVTFTTSRPVDADKPIWARLGRAEVDEAIGHLGEASSDVRDVLAPSSGIPPVAKAYGLLREGSLRATMGDLENAERSLREAESLANAANGTLADLIPRIALVRATILCRAGRFDAAAPLVARAEQAGRTTAAQGLLAPALTLNAAILAGTGRVQAALESAQRALDAPGVRFVERVRARLAVAAASMAAGDADGAIKGARRALDEAKGAELRSEIVEAASLLVAQGARRSEADVDAARRDGVSAFEAWVESCPEDQREHLMHRPDVARWSQTLGWAPQARRTTT